MDKSNFVKPKGDLSKNTELASDKKKVLELLNEARDKSNKGNLDDSLLILKRCVSLAPDFDQVYLVIAEVYRQKGQYQKVLLNLNRAIELVPDNPEAYIMRGEVFRLLKQYEASLNDLNRAIELAPDNPAALGRRGTLFRNINKFAKSLNDYNQAVALDPANSWLYGNRAETFRKLKKYHEAVNDYNQVLVLNPELSWVYERRSYPNLWLGDIEAAHSDFERSWKLKPADLMVGWMAEWTAICQKPFSFATQVEVKERLTQLAEQNPQHYVAYLCRAIVDSIQGDLNSGYNELETACNLLPQEPGAYFWKGLTAAGLGKEDEALSLIEKALDLGMPPVLLIPIRWLEPVNPIFYKKYGQALLARVSQENSNSPEETVNTSFSTQSKNVRNEVNELQPEGQVQPRPGQPSLDETVRFPQMQPFFDENGLTIKLVKPLETFPVEPFSETPVLGSNETEVAQVTQPYKVVPYNEKAVDEPSKLDEMIEVTQPQIAQEVKPLEQLVISPGDKVTPAATTMREEESEINRASSSLISQESLTPEIAGQILATIPTGLFNQPDTPGVILAQQPEFVASINKQPAIKEVRPANIENNNLVSPAKKSRLLLPLIIVRAGLFIAGLLIFILLLVGNENKPATDNQVAASITVPPGGKVTPVQATAPASPASVPAISPPPLNTALSNLTAPTPSSVSQANPTAVLAIYATPVPTTATTSLTVSSNPVTSSSIIPSTAPATLTSTAIPATQVSLSPFKTQPLSGHTGMLTTASWTRDGSYYLTASEDKTIKVWDATTNQVIMTLDDKNRPNTQAVLTARWSDDNQFIISGAADKYVRLYMVSPKQNNLKSAIGLVLIEATDKVIPQAVAIAPDNSLLLYPGPNVVHSWNTNLDDQGPDFFLNSPGADVTALVFTGDSKYLAIGLSTGTVQLWDIKVNKIVLTIPPGQTAPGPVTNLEWLPGEKQLVIAYREALSVYGVNLNGGAVSTSSVSTLPLNIKVNTIAISPDGKRLAVGSPTGQVELCSLEDKKLINQLNISIQQPVPVVGLHWNQTGQGQGGGQELSVVGGGAKPFLANYRIPLTK